MKHNEGLNGSFFSQRLKNVSHEVLMRICQDPSYDPAPDTTKLRYDENLPEISKHLLDMHRVQEYSPDSQQSVVCQYKDGGENFQGFWLYSPHELFDADAVKITTDFVGQVEEDAWSCFLPSLSSLRSAHIPRNPGKTTNALRMGDNKPHGTRTSLAMRFRDYTPTNSFQQGNHMLLALSDCSTCYYMVEFVSAARGTLILIFVLLWRSVITED